MECQSPFLIPVEILVGMVLWSVIYKAVERERERETG